MILYEHWRLRDEVRFQIRKWIRIRRWKSLNFGLEISLWIVAIYFMIWSFEIGIRRYNDG